MSCKDLHWPELLVEFFASKAMANNVTEKIALLDAIIKRAGAIKKRSLEVIHEENILAEDLDRYNELLAPDDELRAEVKQSALMAQANQLEKERKKRNRLPRQGSSASPAKKTKQGSATSLAMYLHQKQSKQR